MYVPGNDKRKIEKISSIGVDCAVLDLEDGVAANKKTEAREFIENIPADFDFGRSEHAVRVNSVQSGLFHDDVDAVFSSLKLPATMLVPKVDNIDHVHTIYQALDKKSCSKDPVNVIIYVESARGLLDLRRVCKTAVELSDDSRFPFQGVVFGSDDFCADIGATRTAEAMELLTARQMIVMTTKLFRLQAIDMVHIDYKDLDGLRKHCKEGAAMGFTGKQVIHPGQVEIVQTAFAPSEEKIEWATELIRLFEEHQKHGKGAFVFRGSMIDRPLLLQAQNIVEIAQQIKK